MIVTGTYCREVESVPMLVHLQGGLKNSAKVGRESKRVWLPASGTERHQYRAAKEICSQEIVSIQSQHACWYRT